MTTEPVAGAQRGLDQELAAVVKHLRRQGLPLLASPRPDAVTSFCGVFLVSFVGTAALGILPWHGTVVTTVSATLVGFLGPILVAIGLVPALLYALLVVVRSTPAVVKSTVREAPVVLAVLVFLFLTSDVWELLASIQTWRLVSILVLFLGAATPMLVLMLSPLVGAAFRFPSSELEELREAAGRTPAASLIDHVEPEQRPQLGLRQKGNIFALLLAKLYFLVITVSLGAFLFFVALGLVAFDKPLVRKWTGHGKGWKPHGKDLHAYGYHLYLTTPLIHVAALLAAIAGLTFAVSVLRDQKVHSEFVDTECNRMKDLIAAWVYLTCASPAAGPKTRGKPFQVRVGRRLKI